MGARVWEDDQALARRNLSEEEIAYLFVDGISARLRASYTREPVLAAWGVAGEGKRVLAQLMAGSKEDHETDSTRVLGLVLGGFVLLLRCLGFGGE